MRLRRSPGAVHEYAEPGKAIRRSNTLFSARQVVGWPNRACGNTDLMGCTTVVLTGPVRRNVRYCRGGSYGRARKSTCPAWMAWDWSSRAEKTVVIVAVKLRSCGKVFVETRISPA